MKKLVLIATAIASVTFVTEASACSSGILADVACRFGVIDQRTANGLDQAHAALGRPIETKILPGIADGVYPGAGQAMRMYDQFNRGGGFGGINGGVLSAPMPVNAPVYPQAMPMGQFCMTPFGAIGPGMPMPRGSACAVPTPQGMVQGFIQ
uniref:Uncharacterized protein n=1 Tax=Agrobacterium albertimagni TaxID=147266 RepID=A0A7C1P8I2_9HYPH